MYLYTTFKYFPLKRSIIIQYEVHLIIDWLFVRRTLDGYVNGLFGLASYQYPIPS